MSVELAGFGRMVARLVADLEPADCESRVEYEFAMEFQALPLGIDLWSLVFLAPDGEMIRAGWDPLEIKRSCLEDDVSRALRMAAERYPALATFVPEFS